MIRPPYFDLPRETYRQTIEKRYGPPWELRWALQLLGLLEDVEREDELWLESLQDS
jgi:hypothetical protein